MNRHQYIQWGWLIGLLLCGCASSHPSLTTDPIKWVDPDTQPIAQPSVAEQNVIWDVVDLTLFYQLGKPLDLEWVSRKIGTTAGIAPPREADNVNALDETPNSSWFTNRHFLTRLSQAELAHGPGIAQPDTTGPWEVISGKFHGVAPGFTIRDQRGDVYYLKFDAQNNEELATTAEVVATKILYAAGYNVPQNSIVFFDPTWLTIGSKSQMPDGQGGKRPMTPEDIQHLLADISKQPNGHIRCVASKRVAGIPLGIFEFHGHRNDDPNDRVYHEYRRELRGLRVIASWINDVDRRAANTLNMYVTDSQNRGHVKHYLMDMGATLGSSTVKPRTPKSGNEYFVDVRQIVPSILALGLYRKPWDEPLPMPYSELGYLESTVFSPKRWVTNYPNPAFEQCSARDGYWGAKIVMSFTENDIRAIVHIGRLSNPKAEAYLVRLLQERQKKIGRYWFSKINPLDRFWVDRDGLHFDDLAILSDLAQSDQTTYRYRILHANGNEIHPEQTTRTNRMPIPGDLSPKQFYSIEIRTERPNASKHPVRVFFYKWDTGRYQIIKVERDT